jgi:hypothetical protein
MYAGSIRVRAAHGGRKWDGGEVPEDWRRAYRLSISLHRNLNSGKLCLESLRADLKKVLENGFWRVYYDPERDTVFENRTFLEFVTKPKPDGLAEDPAAVRALIRDDIELRDLWDEAVKQPVGANQFTIPKAEEGLDNIQALSEAFPSGTSVDAGLRRLRKDRPDLHAAVIDGELSTHAACVQAGFRRKTFTIPRDTVKAVQALVRNFNANEWAEIVALVNSIQHPETGGKS